MTLRRLENLPPRRLSESEMTWLKNRAHDHRPEVKSLACAVFAERFPCTARNQKKQELSILNMEIFANGEIIDRYGDLVYLTENYQVSRTPPAIVRIQKNGTRQTIEPPPKILAKLMDYTDHPRDVADPWYTEDFEATWRDVLEGCQGLLDELTRDKA
mgnify:CR=1 FL=1